MTAAPDLVLRPSDPSSDEHRSIADIETEAEAAGGRSGGLPGRAYAKWGPRYLEGTLFVQQQLVYGVLVLGVAGLSLYVAMSPGEFLRLALVGCGFQFVYSLLTVPVTRRLLRPVNEWVGGARSEEATVAAWRVAAPLPSELLRRYFVTPTLGAAVSSAYLLWTIYLVWELGLPAYSVLLVYAGVVVVEAYVAALVFFGIERIVRPVLVDISAALPDGVATRAPGLSLRARLLVTLPAINVITAVVADAASRGGNATLADLAIVVLVATAVASSVSLVLTLLLANSITGPIAQLRDATQRVGEGDFAARVPVVTTDETGDLARSFNEMAAGLAERERIRETLGIYVDREVAEHILRNRMRRRGFREDHAADGCSAQRHAICQRGFPS